MLNCSIKSLSDTCVQEKDHTFSAMLKSNFQNHLQLGQPWLDVLESQYSGDFKDESYAMKQLINIRNKQSVSEPLNN